ncbi:hypothetical protein H4219_000644 [Mycoemilia scoparia]|uniref:Uncharacterized protein n=1 Tax=Mycoemilia scoparia TaxID=417184 RepID=A0A9W8DSQ5_9FUNG|nr:hypothetical protein H4219_000644 [Mycoemilia scoparia]
MSSQQNRNTDIDYSKLPTLLELRNKAKSNDVELDPSICHNISIFRDIMKRLRKVDDNIILQVNNTNSTSPDACRALFEVMANAYTRREEAIRYCTGIIDDDINELKAKDKNDSQIYSKEMLKQWVLNERFVEDIVRDRSLSVFKSRCQVFNIPKDFKPFLERPN